MSVGTFLETPRGRPSGFRAGRAGEYTVPIVAALTALAAVLRFVDIGHQGFWFDEGNTALLVHFSPGKMLGLIPQSESTPPFYYCVAWVWARLFGDTEAPLRSLSAVAGVLTVPVAAATARKLLSPRAAVITAALVACNPLLIWYSQEARSYALLVLLTAVALLAFAHAREDPSPGRLVAWVLAAALALATHYYAVLASAPQAAWLLVEHRRYRPTLFAVALVTACGLALIPLALSQNDRSLTAWISAAPLGLRLGQVVPEFLIAFQMPAQSVLEPLACALAALAVVLLLASDEPPLRRAGAMAATLGLGGLALILLLVAAGIDDLLTRNLLALWLPGALVVAAGLSAPRFALLGALVALALCAIGVTAAVGVDVDRNFQRPDWRGVARILGPASAPRAILMQHYRDLLPLSLYLDDLRVASRRGVRVAELDIVSFTSPPSAGFCWWGSACNLWPSRMQSAYDIPGFRPAWRRSYNQFTVLRMVARAPVLLTRHDVARALHTTRFVNDELLIQR